MHFTSTSSSWASSTSPIAFAISSVEPCLLAEETSTFVIELTSGDWTLQVSRGNVLASIGIRPRPCAGKPRSAEDRCGLRRGSAPAARAEPARVMTHRARGAAEPQALLAHAGASHEIGGDRDED